MSATNRTHSNSLIDEVVVDYTMDPLRGHIIVEEYECEKAHCTFRTWLFITFSYDKACIMYKSGLALHSIRMVQETDHTVYCEKCKKGWFDGVVVDNKNGSTKSTIGHTRQLTYKTKI